MSLQNRHAFHRRGTFAVMAERVNVRCKPSQRDNSRASPSVAWKREWVPALNAYQTDDGLICDAFQSRCRQNTYPFATRTEGNYCKTQVFAYRECHGMLIHTSGHDNQVNQPA